jgi:hypothetical protein
MTRKRLIFGGVAALLAACAVLAAETCAPFVLGREEISAPVSDVIPVIGASPVQSRMIHATLRRFTADELRSVRAIVIAEPEDGSLRGLEREGWTMLDYDPQTVCSQSWGWPENWRLMILVDAPRCMDNLTEMVVHEVCHLLGYTIAEETQIPQQDIHDLGFDACYGAHIGAGANP